MRNKLALFAVSTILFVVLLYHQIPGFNFLIFGLFIVGISYYYNAENTRNRTLISVYLLITTLSVAIFGDLFSVILSLALFFLIPVYMNSPKEILLIAPIQSFISYALSFLQLPAALNQLSFSGSSNKLIKFLSYVLMPFVVLLVFFLIYREINIDFKYAFDRIEIPNIDEQLIFIIFLGSIYCFGFWFYKKYIDSKYYEKYTNENIEPTPVKNKEDEQIWSNSGIILFSLLNLLLAVLLYFEFNEIYCNQEVANLSEYSEEVHLSVSSVIGSIVIAVILIMIYFKGNLNFGSQSKVLKATAYVWIILNSVLLITSTIKNNFYIENLGLTEKRLGVYAFLLLAMIGLGFTFYKIAKNKSDYYLVNSMAWVFLTFAVSICPINWSKIITNYNVNQYERNGNNLDISYLKTLHYNDLQMMNLYDSHPELFDNSSESIINRARHRTELSKENNFLSDCFYNIKVRKELDFPKYEQTNKETRE